MLPGFLAERSRIPRWGSPQTLTKPPGEAGLSDQCVARGSGSPGAASSRVI